MKRELYPKIFLLICSVLICLIIGEAAIRQIGRYDADKNFFFGKMQLKPYYLPVATTEEKLSRFLPSENSWLIYDSALGWLFNPNRGAGLQQFNADYIRTVSPDDKFSKVPKRDVLRIAIFGDSYTHGAEAPFEDTWGQYLEKNLEKAGIPCEVLNFGVSGYGMDQAFLCWEKLGRKFSPHIVILGFQPEMTYRNLNLIRPIYFARTGIPFSKPRYLLEQNELRLINLPVLPPQEIIGVMENMESWDLRQHEYWFKPENYKKSIWLKSKLVSFFSSAIDELTYEANERRFYSLGGEHAQLAIKIVDKFKESVEANGAEFYIVNLPYKESLIPLLKGRDLTYIDLLERFSEITFTIRPEDNMINEARNSSLDALFLPREHYSVFTNRIVGDVIAEAIIAQSW